MGGPDRVGGLEELSERPVLEVIVELFVVERASREDLFAVPALGRRQPIGQTVDGVHRARIVDVIRGDQRRIEAARARCMEQLEYEVSLVGGPVEDPIDPEILRADRVAQVFPLGIFGIGRGRDRARTHMAERAGHANPVGTHQVSRQIIGRVLVVASGIPFLCGRLVKVRIGEEPQPEHARGIAVIGAARHRLAARSNRNAGILAFVLERIGSAVGAPFVEPKPEPVRIATGRLFETRFVDEPKITPTIIAAVFQAGMRGQNLQEIKRAEGVAREHVPEPVVAPGPDEPSIASPHFAWRQGDAAIHVVKVVLLGGHERGALAAGATRLIDDCSGLRSAVQKHHDPSDGHDHKKQAGGQRIGDYPDDPLHSILRSARRCGPEPHPFTCAWDSPNQIRIMRFASCQQLPRSQRR
jgi:hypothetical protein